MGAPRTFVRILKRARKDLEAIPQGERRRVGERIAALAADPSPRGVDSMQSKGLHLRIRVGTRRICYQVREDEIVIVTITTGSRTVEGTEPLTPVSGGPASAPRSGQRPRG
jgi:mRNA interferase RelE/StbE